MLEDNLESIADSLEKVKLKVEPSAPGPPHLPSYAPGGVSRHSLHPETWRELRAQCFPVFQDAQDTTSCLIGKLSKDWPKGSVLMVLALLL